MGIIGLFDGIARLVERFAGEAARKRKEQKNFYDIRRVSTLWPEPYILAKARPDGLFKYFFEVQCPVLVGKGNGGFDTPRFIF